MADLKTVPNNRSVTRFLDGIHDARQREDCYAILKLMAQVTKGEPRMWGPSIVGFGSYHYKYASGHEGDCFLTGFSPRKQNLTLYVMSGFEAHDALMKKLGRHKTGKSCLYIKRLDEIHMPTLTKLIQQSVKQLDKTHS